MKKLIIGIWHPSVVMTYIGLGFSVTSIGAALYGKIALSFVFLILAAVCDMFDGVIARCFKRTDAEKEFGIQIDSLVDVCSFVITPLCILICVCKDHPSAYIVAIFYAVLGVVRLAWFNTTANDAPDCFFGLPVIYSALLLPATYLFLSLFTLSSDTAAWIWSGVYALLAVLFVCNFRMKKPGIVFRLIMLAVAIGLIFALLLAV